MSEKWKLIDGFDNYMISTQGNLYNCKTKKLLKPTIFDNRYRFATLYKNGKSKKVKISRLVAKTFIPNPRNLPCVNHKDENKLNDCVDNLEWCTYSYNINYGTANNKRSKALGYKVAKIDTYTNGIIEIYDSITDAAFYNKCSISNICRCCKHADGFKTCGGYKWEYYGKEGI